MRSARDFSVDFVLPSLWRVFDKKTIFGDKLKHVIEPRAVYRYVNGIGEDFNRFIRFGERDILSNTNAVLLSLANRVYAKRGEAVAEILTWEVMQKRYFDPTFGGVLSRTRRNQFYPIDTFSGLTPRLISVSRERDDITNTRSTCA